MHVILCYSFDKFQKHPGNMESLYRNFAGKFHG